MAASRQQQVCGGNLTLTVQIGPWSAVGLCRCLIYDQRDMLLH
jgi:hypothetical protein